MSDLAELYETEDTALVLGDVGEILTSEKLRGLNFTVIRNVYVPTSTTRKCLKDYVCKTMKIKLPLNLKCDILKISS